MTIGNSAACCVWITDAGSGLGHALVRRTAVVGWRVAASARRAESLAELEKEAPNLPRGD